MSKFDRLFPANATVELHEKMSRQMFVIFCAFVVLLHGVTGRVTPQESICIQSVQAGTCKTFIPRFYYNPHSGDCKKFMYSGCLGNKNRFTSYQTCLKTCK